MSDTINCRPYSIVKLFDTPLNEVNVVDLNINTYTVITINPYTLEEELKTYPVVLVHQSPRGCPYTVININ